MMSSGWLCTASSSQNTGCTIALLPETKTVHLSAQGHCVCTVEAVMRLWQVQSHYLGLAG
jgi:hypothetical protein